MIVPAAQVVVEQQVRRGMAAQTMFGMRKEHL
jgi:hypothetical protein